MDVSENMELSRAVAPEDLRAGDYVCVLKIVHEECEPFGSDDCFWNRPEPRRMLYLPRKMEVLRVVDACLPSVLVQRPGGRHRTIDVRRFRLARVSPRFGQAAFEKLKPKDDPPKNESATETPPGKQSE